MGKYITLKYGLFALLSSLLIKAVYVKYLRQLFLWCLADLAAVFNVKTKIFIINIFLCCMVPLSLAYGKDTPAPSLGIITGIDSLTGHFEIRRVFKGGSGETSGLQVGDMILKINEIKIVYEDHIAQAVAQNEIGDTVTLEIVRDDSSKTIKVVLKPAPTLTIFSMVDMLEDMDSNVREFAGEALEEIEEDSVVTVLIEALKNDADARKKTALALGYIGDSSAVSSLIQVLREKKSDVRKAVTWALGKIGNRSAVPALAKILEKDSDSEVKAEAARSLGLICRKRDDFWGLIEIVREEIEGAVDESMDFASLVDKAIEFTADRSAVPSLLNALGDESTEVRAYAAEALGQIGDKAATQSLCMVLAKDDDESVRLAAVSALDEIDDVSGVHPLIEAVRDKSAKVRLFAVEALYGINDTAVVAVLIEALDDTDLAVRQKAVVSLGGTKNVSAITALSRMLKDKSTDVRQSAASALGNIGGRSAVPSLVKMLMTDSDGRVRKEAAWALGEIKDKSGALPLVEALEKDSASDVRQSAAAALGKIKDSTVVSALVSVLKVEYDGDVKSFVLEALGQIGDRSVISVLIDMLIDSDARVRKGVVHALGLIGDTSSIRALIEVLKDSVPEVREEAAMVIGRMGSVSAVPALVRALKDESADVRRSAGEALGTLKDKQAVNALIDALGDKSSEVRIEIIEALGQIGDVSAVPALVKALTDGNEYIRWYAAGALGDIGDAAATPALIRVLNDEDSEVRTRAAVELMHMRDSSMVPLLIDVLGCSNADARARAAWLLGCIGDSSVVPSLAEVLKDANADARRKAAWALGQIKDKSAAPVLIKALGDENADVRRKVARSLGWIGAAPAVPALIDVLKNDSDHYVRNHAAWALGYIGDTSAVPVLIETLGDENAGIRDGAAGALGKIKAVNAIHALVPASVIAQPSRVNIYFKAFDNIVLSHLKESYEELKKIYKRTKYVKEKALVLCLMGEAEYELGMDTSSLNRATDAMRMVDPSGNEHLNLKISLLKARCELHLEKFDQCLITLDGADYLNRMIQEDIIRDVQKIEIMYLRGELQRLRGMPEEALKSYELANADLSLLKEAHGFMLSEEEVDMVLQKIQSSVGEVSLQMSRKATGVAREIADRYDAQKRDEWNSFERTYTVAIKLALADGNYEEAQKVLEKYLLKRNQWMSKGMTLRFSDKEKQQLLVQWQDKQRVLENLEQQIMELKQQAGVEVELGKLNKERQNNQRDLKIFIIKLKDSHPDLAALIGAEPTEIIKLQKILPQDAALIQYLMLKDTSYIFLITAETIEMRTIVMDREKMTNEISYLRGLLGNRSADQEAIEETSAELYEWLIEPIEDKLSRIKVIGLIPSGILHYVPFAVLGKRTQDRFVSLIDSFTLFEMNSSTLLGVAMDHGNTAHLSGIVAFGDPDGSLPSAREEANNVKEKVGKGIVYIGQKAKKDILLKGNYADHAIHLATHADLAPHDNLLDSYILFADGRLRLEEIWGVNLQNVPIVVLSACNTHIGSILSGDELVSLANGFIYAGCGSVLGTLWKVADVSTAELMVAYYDGYAAGKSRAEALATAQRALKNDAKYAHPFFWAPFVLIGDWR